MPYTEQMDREIVLTTHLHAKPGDLAYELATVIDTYYLRHGISYTTISSVDGVLGLLQHLLRTQIHDPYEAWKREQNGEVFLCLDDVPWSQEQADSSVGT